MEEVDTQPELVFIERAPHEKGFAAHFDAHIKPKLEELENVRLQARADSRKRSLIAVGLGIAGVGAGVIVWWGLEVHWGWIVFAGIIAVGFLFWMVSRLLDQYIADRRRILILEVLQFVHEADWGHGFGTLEYDPDGEFGDQLLKASHLFEDFDTQTTKGLIMATYRGRRFTFSEVELSVRSSNGGP